MRRPIYHPGELSQALRSLPDGIGAITFKIGRIVMSRFWSAAILLGILSATPASAWDRGDVDVLAVLPDVTPGVPSSVEGLTVGPDGNIYAPTFGFNASGVVTGPAVLFVIKPNGDLVRKVTIAGSTGHMLGLGFNPVSGDLLVIDFF